MLSLCHSHSYIIPIDNRILDEESFIKALKEDQGRSTNLSLFDEIRLSFCNMSRLNNSGMNSITCDKYLDSFSCEKVLDNSFVVVGTQTEFDYSGNEHELYSRDDKAKSRETVSVTTIAIQTEFEASVDEESYNQKHKEEIQTSSHTTVAIQTELESYDDINKVNSRLALDTQDGVPERPQLKTECTAVGVQTENELESPCNKVQILNTQTEYVLPNNNNNHSKCLECEKINKYTAKLERDVHISRCALSEMQMELTRCEGNLDILQKFVDEGNERNSISEGIIKSLEGKIGILEVACAKQRERLDSLAKDELAKKNICGMLHCVVYGNICEL